MLTGKVGNLFCKFSSVVDGARRHFVKLQDAIRNGNTMIVFTESWCLVNDACSIRFRHIFVGNHSKSVVFELMGERLDKSGKEKIFSNT
jgi:hypothetical protein